MDQPNIHIVPYTAELATHFGALNMAWLSKYFTVEPWDELVLSQPQNYVIDKGGAIYFAQIEDEIVGTFALIATAEKEYELSKMAVAEQHRGKKIGNVMLAFCLQEAKRLGADKLILFSNTVLEPAIHLYKKFGFKQVPLGNSTYVRSDIKMEIDLTTI